MIANYHTHTKWCNHAKGEAEDYIREAIRLGLKEIAITDHVPHIDNSDTARMRWEEFEAYNQLLDKTIEQYKDQITIYKGFECEYEPDALGFYKTLINKYDYTVMVLGQHSCGENRKYTRKGYGSCNFLCTVPFDSGGASSYNALLRNGLSC